MIALGLDNCGLVNITVYYPGCPENKPVNRRLFSINNIVLFDVRIVTVYRNPSAYLLLFSFDALAVSKGMPAAKLCNKSNSSVLSWRCRLMQVELYNGCKMVVVVVVTFLVARNALTPKYW